MGSTTLENSSPNPNARLSRLIILAMMVAVVSRNQKEKEITCVFSQCSAYSPKVASIAFSGRSPNQTYCFYK